MDVMGHMHVRTRVDTELLEAATAEVRLSAETTATGESRAVVPELRGHTGKVHGLLSAYG